MLGALPVTSKIYIYKDMHIYVYILYEHKCKKRTSVSNELASIAFLIQNLKLYVESNRDLKQLPKRCYI